MGFQVAWGWMCLSSPKGSENGLREQGGWRRQISRTRDEGRAE